jgi:hypothetical protein
MFAPKENIQGTMTSHLGGKHLKKLDTLPWGVKLAGEIAQCMKILLDENMVK